MHFDNFTTTPCEVILSNNDVAGTITNDTVKAFLCIPHDNTTEQTHLSADELTLQYIVGQVERFPNTQIFISINNKLTEMVIDVNGVITPKT